MNSLLVGKNPVPVIGTKPKELIDKNVFTLLILQISYFHSFPETP